MEEGLQCVKHKEKLLVQPTLPWVKKVEETFSLHVPLYLQVRLMLCSPGRGTRWPVSFWQVFDGFLKTEFHRHRDEIAVGGDRKDNLCRSSLQVLTFCDENTGGVDAGCWCGRRCETFMPPKAVHRSIYRAAAHHGANQVRWEWCSAMSGYGTGV